MVMKKLLYISDLKIWSQIGDMIGWRRQNVTSSVDTDISLDNVNDFFRTIAVSADHQPANYFHPGPGAQLGTIIFIFVRSLLMRCVASFNILIHGSQLVQMVFWPSF